MMNNYNSLSYRKLSKLSSQEPDVVGNAPNTVGKMRTSWLLSLLLVAMIMFNYNAWSQVSNYSFSSTTSTYTPLVGGTVVNTAAGLTTSMSTNSDDGAILVTLPFTFTYNGTAYTQATMCTNGWVGLGSQLTVTASQGRSGGNLFTNTAPNNLLAAWFGDGNANFPSPNPGSMRHGSSGTDIYTFEYNQVTGDGFTAGTTILISFQIRIYGPASTNPGRIEFIYGPRTGTISTGRSIGIAGTNTDYFNAVTGNTTTTTTASAFPAVNTTYVFTPPTPCSGVPTAGTVTPSTRPTCTAVAPGSFTVSGFSTGVTGITFQWLESSSPTGPFGPVTGSGSGATTATYTPPPFLGTTIYYVCRVTCSNGGAFADTAPVSVTPPLAPTTQASAIASSAISYTGFTTSWTNGNGARRVVYLSNAPIVDPVNGSAAAFTANTVYSGSGQQVVADGTASSVSVTGLIPGTLYYVKVYEYQRCGAGPYEYYFNTITGTNATTVSTSSATVVPWSEGFATTTLPTNWINPSFWTISTTAALSPATTNVIYYNLYDFATSANFTTLIAGSIPSNYQLSFDYRLANYDSPYAPPAVASGNYIIAISTNNGATFTNVATVSNNGVAGWQPYSLPLASYVGQNIRIRITGNWTAGDYYLAFDNFKIDAIPSCYVPTGLSASNLTATTADVTWVAPTSGTTPLQYEYAVTTSATPPTSGTVSTSNSVTGVTITPLVNYYLHVRSECALGTDYSNWATSAPFQFIPGDVCATAIDLGALTSPYSGTTVGTAHNFSPSCNSAATSPDLYYSIVVPAGYTLNIGQTTNGYDSVHSTFYGDCVTQTAIQCMDDPDTLTDGATSQVSWVNSTGISQTVYWVQDGYNGSNGTFTLQWSVTPPPIVVTSFAPTFACTNELASTIVTLTGSNFTGATDVTLNGVSTPFTVVNDTTITVALQATSTAGTFVVYNAVTSGTNTTALPVNVSPTVSPIVGSTEICLSSPTTTLTNATGGTVAWSSSNTAVATINASTGEVTALSAGSTMISYSVTSVEGCVTTVTHNLDVREQVAIGTQPLPQVVVTGNNATFSVAATGTGLNYQWEESIDNGGTFSPLSNAGVYSGVDTATLTLTAVPDTMNTYEYRCVVTGTSPCAPETSNSALLTVGNTGIATNPSNVNLCDSGDAIFTVAGTGDVNGYQWYEYDGTNVNTLTNTGDYSGADTATLTVSNANNMRNGYVYYADIIGPANTVTTTSATLNIATGVSVGTNPASQSVCYSGGSTVFTSAASGSFTGVQWQYSPDNSSWGNVVNGTPAGATYTNATTESLTVATTSATPATGTHYYRALYAASAPCLAVSSDSAQLSIFTPSIDTTPVAATVFAGNTVVFTANSVAPGATYQWQRSATLGGTYTDVTDGTPATVTYSGATSSALTVATTSSTVASTTNFYRVVVTSNGCSVASVGAQLTINNYCTVSTTNSGDYTSAFSTTAGATNLSYTATSQPSGSYSNQLAQTLTVTESEAFNFSHSYVGGSNGLRIWIDFNSNATFDTTEQLFSATSSAATQTGSITIPAGTPAGTYRMRVRSQWNALPPACGNVNYGTTMDYTVVVLTRPACDNTPIAGTAVSSVANVCFSGAANLSASGFTTGVTGISMQWHNSAGPISGANAATYTTPVLTASESYFLRVTCDNSGLFADTNTLNIGVSSPSVDSTIPAERCGTGTVILNATSSVGTSLNWYTAATGGSLVGSGTSFTTPSITATTNYYVSAENVGNGNATIGVSTTTTSTDGVSPFTANWEGSRIQYIVRASELINSGLRAGNITNMSFDVTAVSGYLQNGYTVKLANSSATAFSDNFVTPTSSTTVYGPLPTQATAVGLKTLNFSTPFSWDGVSNILVEICHDNDSPASTCASCYGTTATVRYSTTSYNSVYGKYADNNTMCGTSNGSAISTFTNRPNMVFGGQVATCSSTRTMVTATVNTPPSLSLSSASATICSGSSTVAPVTITSTVGDYDTYTWSPSLGVSGDANSGYTFNPTATTSYTLTATNAAGCANTASFVVTVNPIPTPIVTPSATEICSNAVLPVLLNASTVSGAVTGGCLSGYLYPSATSTPSTCNGVSPNLINSDAWPGEYANVNVSSNTKYTFTSSVATDYLTISDANGTTVLAAGTTPLVWTSNSAMIVRYYIHTNSACGTQSVDRVRSVICAPSETTFVWSPTSGLYTDAAGTSTYTGDSRANVYAKPTATTVYTVTATLPTGCFATSTTTVTVLTPTTYYADIDGDGYGNEAVILMSCTPVAGYVTVAGDCNDNVASINPGAVDVCYDGIDNDCNGIIDNVGLPGGCTPIVSTMPAAQCGTTVSGLSTSMYATNISGAQGYRFKVTNMSTMSVQIIERPVNNLAFSAIPGVTYNTQYQVEIGVKYNNVWQPFYGSPCFINTPNPVSTPGAQCGTTLTSMSQWVYTTYVPNVTAYRFRVINLVTNQEQIFTTSTYKFNFTQLASRAYNTTYSVEVSLRNTNGEFLPYNSSCNVTTPSFPETSVRDSQCDYTALSNTEMIAAVVVPTATVYRFFIYNTALEYEATIDRSLNTFNLNMFTGLTPGATYSVQVSVKIGDEFGPYGKVCSLTTPGLAKEQTITKNIVDFKAVAYPNPFAENFKLDVNTSSEEVIKVSVYDMIGKQVEQRQINVSDVESFEVGSNYPSGVYNVIVTQGENTQTLRVIKR